MTAREHDGTEHILVPRDKYFQSITNNNYKFIYVLGYCT